MRKLVIVQTSAPDYRAAFFSAIKEELKENFELYSGPSYFEPSVRSDRNIRFQNLKNHFFLNRKFLFQTGHWHLLFKNIVIVLELNPRIVSNWIFLIFRKIMGFKTVLWGHAWPRNGKDSKSDRLRNIMRTFGSEIIVYTRQQREELRQHMPNKEINAAPNALFSIKKMEAATGESEPCNLIYVGRLTQAKKIFFLVKAFHHSLNAIPPHVKLFIVGEGEERKKIEAYIEENRLEEKILIQGHISDFEKLKELYSKAIFSVSPGYVGLSITQSLGYGVPILISENENHSPEIEAAQLNENALFFESDNMEDFKKTLKKIFEEKSYWLSQRQEIVSFCKKRYSVEAMAKVFINLSKKYGT